MIKIPFTKKELPWNELCKFLAGASFQKMALCLFLYFNNITLPVLYLNTFQMTPIFFLAGACITFPFFVAFVCFGYLNKTQYSTRS
jgi:hypothetical protein